MDLETKKRGLFKSISWKLFGTLNVFVIVYLVTESSKLAITISLIEIVTKTILFLAHEKVWDGIEYGKIKDKPTEYEI
jgi:uncharacterized membrane protein